MKKNYFDDDDDSFHAFLVEDANFTENEEYPIIESWMIPDSHPKK